MSRRDVRDARDVMVDTVHKDRPMCPFVSNAIFVKGKLFPKGLELHLGPNDYNNVGVKKIIWEKKRRPIP
jgi:hypothetical protein